MQGEEKVIYTIGHSTRQYSEFCHLLRSFNIEVLADIRRFPSSKRYPHFNKEMLQVSLPQQNIQYSHLPGLGGKRKAQDGSKNLAWRNQAFRGYADHMDSNDFKQEITILRQFASGKLTAYMCAEAVWWRCHRALVSDLLKSEGWKVFHILSENKLQEHPYTSAAKIISGKLDYTGDDEQLLFRSSGS